MHQSNDFTGEVPLGDVLGMFVQLQVTQLHASRFFECGLSPNIRPIGDMMPKILESMLPCGRDSLEVVGKSTITGKYQLTLPKTVRELLKVDNGDLLVFIKDHDKIVVKRGTVKIEE